MENENNAVKLCTHVKADGTCCGSPALSDESYCFFHRASRERIKRQRRTVRLCQRPQLPILEDQDTVQLAIGDVLNFLLAGQIDYRVARLLLTGLRTAASNFRHLPFGASRSTRSLDHYQDPEEEILQREIQVEIDGEDKEKAKRTEECRRRFDAIPDSMPRSPFAPLSGRKEDLDAAIIARGKALAEAADERAEQHG